MFYVGSNPILADDMEVLETLKSHLALNGIYRFAQFKPSSRNIQFNCPIHNDGQERKPSCGISTVNHENTPAGTVHCFTCGYTASIEKMVSDCFGKQDDGEFGKQWLIKNFLTVSVENRKSLELSHMMRGGGKNVTVQKYIPEDVLDSYRYYHDYMYQRKLTDQVIDKFDVGYDKAFVLVDKDGKKKPPMQCVTFPVRDITGGTLFIARRSINTKFFHYPDGVDKPVYGVYELPEDADEVVICESIINALTCYVYGKPAVALLGLGTQAQYETLKQLPVRKYIIGLDPDKAGTVATNKLREALYGFKLVTSYVIPPNRDINDLSKKEFDNLEEIF